MSECSSSSSSNPLSKRISSKKPRIVTYGGPSHSSYGETKKKHQDSKYADVWSDRPRVIRRKARLVQRSEPKPHDDGISRSYVISDPESDSDSEPDLDKDDELLRPNEWQAEIKDIEGRALIRSHFWLSYCSMGKSSEVFDCSITTSPYDWTGLLSTLSKNYLSDVQNELFTSWEQSYTDLKETENALGRSRDWPEATNLKVEIIAKRHATLRFRSQEELSLHQLIDRCSVRSIDDLFHCSSMYRPQRPVSFIPSMFESLAASREILIMASHSIECLQQSGICHDKINILVYDRPRIVKVVPITLSKVVELVGLLDFALRNLLSSWLEGFHLPHHNGPHHVTERHPSALFDLALYTDLLHNGSMTELTCFWSLIARAIDFGIVSFVGSHLSPRIASHLNLSEPKNFPLSVDDQNEAFDREYSFFRGFEYTAVTLECLDDFLRNRDVWVLQNGHHRIQGRAYISTSIEDLSDLWGPILKLDKQTNAEDQSMGCYYALGAGAIGSTRDCSDDDIEILPNEILCHYVPSISQMEAGLDLIKEQNGSTLLIGAYTSEGLTISSCPTKQPESLEGILLRPQGTVKSSKFKASTTYSISTGYSGSTIGAARQYQYRDGITQKQRILAKWLKYPGSTHPDSLLMWYGVEVSACTRNARRRQLWEIIRSEAVVQAFHHGLFEWKDPECEMAFHEVLQSDDPRSFSKLYLDQKR